MARSPNDDVTVVITCFNYGAYLPEAVESVRRQEGGPARVVVVDDGSTEAATLAALDDAQREPGVEVIHQANSGTAAARNTGLRRLTTPYAAVLDADDVLPPGALRAMLPALQSDSQLGYVYGHIQFFGQWSGTMRMPPFDPWRLLFRHIIGPTALMRREVFEAVGGYDPVFHYEDWEFWVHALASGWSGRQLGVPCLLHRKHGTSKFSSDRPNYHEDFANLRIKHRPLYGELSRVERESKLGPAERFLYRRIWGPRPWPARAETTLYSLLWRPR